MKRILQFLKTLFLLYVIGAGVYLVFFEKPAPVRAFTDSSPVPLPFWDTSVIPGSGNECGYWMTDGRRDWFVPYPGACGNSSRRTFYRKKAEQEQLVMSFHETLARLNNDVSRHKAAKRTARIDADFAVTYDDMQKVYTYNADFIESVAYPQDVQMDLGLEDPEFTTAQHWTLPGGLEFSTLQRKILDPQYTPYGGLAPEATHCLYIKTPNKGFDIYTYYQLDEEGLWYEGVNMEGANLEFADYDDDEVMTLPLNYDTDYQSGSGEGEDWTIDCDTTWYGDGAYEVEAWYFWSEGYGTLETPDEGTVDVIKIAYQWIWSYWEVDEESEDEDILVEFDNGTEVYFYSKQGHQVMVFMDSLGIETSGIVKPDMIYYQKVRQPGTFVNEKPLMIKPDMQFYPNPTSGLIRFTQPTTFELFDILGRRMQFGENTLQADFSHLPRGLYFMKPHKGNVQKVIIQK
ncbi:MAG TPA: T9SS type A sorting domain-containing protein [bacterium]|nr:T9SS type A sorting domain-containing protein [bacterium]HPN44579.1 T9SS type A sorting domain-containing protein [bacterium]